MMTGYPLYPYKGISIPFKWRIEKEIVENVNKGITNWANGIRSANLTPEQKKEARKMWIKTRLFLQHRRIDTSYPLILGIIGLVLLFYYYRMDFYQSIIFSLPAVANIAIWYFLFPDSRFSGAAFWWFGAGFGIFLFKVNQGLTRFTFFIPLLIFLSLITHVFDPLGQAKDFLPTTNYQKVISTPTLRRFETRSGFIYSTPIDGDQCWDAPLPCSPYMVKNLALIDGKSMAGGFYVLPD